MTVTPAPPAPPGHPTPQRGRHYSPNYGYEPYWPGGHWVQAIHPDKPTTLKPAMVCGKECNYLLRDIKEVCGRNIDNTYVWTGHNKYARYDDLVWGYKTFDSYCSFLHLKCDSEKGSRPKLNRWIFVHIGKCEMKQELEFKPLYGTEPMTRMKGYLQDIERDFLKLAVTPCESK